MADTFLLEIVTPYGHVLSTEADLVEAPGSEGEFGVLAGHALFITPLKAGEVSFTNGQKRETFATGPGFAEVLADRTTILVDSAERGSEMDLEGVREELREAEEALKGLSEDDPEYRKAEEALELANARLKVVEKVKG
jgi:F-type H+-transporting ATPase subunit epsilon